MPDKVAAAEIRESGFGDKELAVARMPGHWLLARLGKRVLRPGGLELTRRMMDLLGIGAADAVVELAPGLGASARMVLERGPYSYTAVERDASAADTVGRYLEGEHQRCVVGDAENTGLVGAGASVVFGEAMLTMQRPEQKRRIVAEAHRLLASGGRYGIHELCFVPEGLDGAAKGEIQRDLSRSIHVGARPLTSGEWRELLELEGFEVLGESTAPMRLLEPGRLFRDEGVGGALRFVVNVLRDGEARARVLAMRGVFRKHRRHMAGITLVAVKPERGIAPGPPGSG